ncbi:ArsR/SmtB family transcription factor [Microbacterium sp. A84]|uniref:ArsR/SmtB family transcription factor n=1 Tax=Microbacterium sp. A84 TaxID=3450715 RepID=UPI003F43CCA0
MSRDLSVIGHALSAPTRSAFLNMLMDGSSRPAGELASAAGVSASTASEHLSVLLDAGLIACKPRGRQRFYVISDADVAGALERLGHLCPPAPEITYRQAAGARDLAHARLCYDHLAGRLGIALADSLVENGWVDTDLVDVTPSGASHLRAQGIEVNELTQARRRLIRGCPDWTERRPHLAGSLGSAMAQAFIERGWVVRRQAGRGLEITRAGHNALKETWRVSAPL